jgi:hypothetical protein
MVARDPRERVLLSRAAAATRWAKTTDRAAATEPARRGLRARFAREADPEGILPDAELEKRVDQLHRAHMLKMSAAARRARAAKTAEAVDRA